MYRFSFHGIDSETDQLYKFARDRDRAIKALGPRVLDSVVPGLSQQIPATDPSSFDHLLTQGKDDADCGMEFSMSREQRIKFAMDTASPSQLVEKSKLGPFSFLNQRGIDRLTRGSIDITSHKK